jgi:hypothetical protein
MNERKKKGTRWLGLVTALLLLGMLTGLAGEIKPAVADTHPPPPPTWGVGPCVYEDCNIQYPNPGLNCTSEDMRIARLDLYEVTNYCQQDPEGTGIFEFRVEFIAGSKERYSPFIWMALDGGDAKLGTCYKDYLEPVDATAVDLLGGYGPFWDLDGDVCGDVKQDELNVKIIGPVELNCDHLALLDTSYVAVLLGWDNQAVDCSVENGCPGTAAKCKYDPEVPFDVSLRQVDLAITKTAKFNDEEITIIPENGMFDYDLVVTHTGAFDPYFASLEPPEYYCFDSTGYRITDNLPTYLKIQDTWLPYMEYDNGDLMVECDTEPDDTESCYPNCGGYGDLLTCRIYRDLPCTSTTNPPVVIPNSAPAITVPVQLWMGRPSDPTGTPFDNLNILPDFIENTGCVAGNEFDWIESNNCDDAEVTEVTLEYFTTTAYKQEIAVEWKTVSEVDNLGFKLYRGTSPLRSDSVLIFEASSTASTGGATYTFIDKMGGRMGLRPNTVYYYWLADIPASGIQASGMQNIYGPESASLLLGSKGK